MKFSSYSCGFALRIVRIIPKPFYGEDNKTLHQSLAIARYVTVTHNLRPTDLWNQAQLVAMVLGVYDFVSKMAKKLHYFDFKGIAESIRFMLHYADQKFEDIRYDYKTFSEADVKKTFPFGQLPVYEEGNRTLNQSLAIARYVGAAHNLMPTDPWDQAQLDAVVFTVYDFWAKIVTYLMEQEPVKREKLRREVFEEVINFYLSRFEDQLKNNRGYFGGTISWADFVFIGILESVKLHLGDQIYLKYPHIVALQEIITTLPRVKEYISTRKHDVM